MDALVPALNQQQIAKVANEWMRRYIQEPARFEAEFRTVGNFMNDNANGREPTYGEECAAYMVKIAREIGA